MKRKWESNTATLSQRAMNSAEAVGQEAVRTPGLVRTLITDGTLQTRTGIQARGILRQDNGVRQKCFVCPNDAEAGGWFCQMSCDDKRIYLCSPYCALSHFKTLNPTSGANGQEHADDEECVHSKASPRQSKRVHLPCYKSPRPRAPTASRIWPPVHKILCGVSSGTSASRTFSLPHVRGVGIVHRDFAALGKIGGESSIDDVRRPVQRVELAFGNDAALIGREIRNEISFAPDRRVEDVHQSACGSRLFVPCPKPLADLENRFVHLGRIPPEMRTAFESGSAAEIAPPAYPAN
jgi:hypothetical protein